MTNDNPSPLVLVTAATGKTGRRVAEHLDRLGVACRRASRSTTPPFDWEDPTTWPAALEGVTAAYLAFAPDLAMPGAVGIIERFCAAAARAGVAKLVLLTGRGEEESIAAEDAVRSSGTRWTVVRASWFAQNFSEDYLLEAVLAGEIALPANDVPEPFVDADDIADVAVAALMDPRHDGHTYDVTGPRLLSFADAAAKIAAATGHAIRYVPLTTADYRAGAIAHGVPEPVAGLLADVFARVLDGRNAHVGNGVFEALGRPARDFADYVRRTVSTGIWTPAPIGAAR